MAWGQNSRLFSFGFQNKPNRQREQNQYTAIPPQQQGWWQPQPPQGVHPFQGMQPSPHPYPGMTQQPSPHPYPGMAQQPSPHPYPGMAQQPSPHPYPGMAQQPSPHPHPGMAQQPSPHPYPSMAQQPSPQAYPSMAQQPSPHPNQMRMAPQQNPNQVQAAPKQNIPPEAKVTPLNGASFDEIKKQVLQNANLPAVPNEASSAPQAFPPATSNPFTPHLKQLIQNEANGEQYYISLSQMCGNAEHGDMVREIAGECMEHKTFYTEQYKRLSAENYSPEARDIARVTHFADGVSLALREENKMLKQLKDFYKKAPDQEKIKLVPYVLDKIARINSLSYLQ